MATIIAETREERRRLPVATATPIIRADADDENSERFHGYASVFNSRTAIGNPLRWGFYEEIASGAFTKTLDEGDARMLIDHDTYYVVSRVSAGTLDLAQDKKGLKVDSALDDDLSYVSDLKANLRNGNVTGMSFGFYVIKDDWLTEEIETVDGDTAEVDVRIIREVKLIEVSSVTFPAYADTEAGLRSVATALAHRGDYAALEKRAKYKPELMDMVTVVKNESAGATRKSDTEPGKSTQLTQSDLINAYAARYGLPIR